MLKTEFLGFRATPAERATIEALRDAYRLRSLSEAIRWAVVNAERGLPKTQRVTANVAEVKHEPQA